MKEIQSKVILTKNKYSDQWFGNDYTINLYRGCMHGCIYCDSRSCCYGIENFDEIKVKKDACLILEKELMKKKRKGVIGIGAMSDTYNPFEKKLEVTRKVLKLIDKYNYGVSIDTKSHLILRDLDILKKINEYNNVIVKITVTCSEDDLSKIIEPNVCVSSKRFEVIKKLSDEGIYCGVLMTPILPFINDNEDNIKNIVRLAYENGAKFIYTYFGMTLRDNQRDYYYDKLDHLFPGLKEKYMKRYGNRYYCQSKNRDKLRAVFIRECKKYGLLYKMEDIIKDYKKNMNFEQLSLFDM